jgi:hypothetical protein
LSLFLFGSGCHDFEGPAPLRVGDHYTLWRILSAAPRHVVKGD